jgi:hypothetical protein
MKNVYGILYRKNKLTVGKWDESLGLEGPFDFPYELAIMNEDTTSTECRRPPASLRKTGGINEFVDPSITAFEGWFFVWLPGALPSPSRKAALPVKGG